MTGSNGFLYLGGTDVFWQDEVGNLVGSTTSTFTVNYDSNNNGTGVFRIITGGSDVLLIDNAGNVGIGTSSPLYKLDVAGHVGFKDKLSGGNTTNGAVIHLRFDASFQSESNVWRYRIGGSPTAGGFALGFFDNVPNLWLKSNGNVGVGTTSPGSYKLAVNGNIRAKDVIVETGWSDFVFADDYRLKPLHEVEQYIQAHKHFPDIPSATEVEENGVALGDMQARLLQKVEELTLYVIELDKENQALKERVAELEE
ncbi:MAG: hypothetical protein IID14_06190 [Candidatus Marinimicrobia bacterium]|nr:hypothetical protein [Candidatus Neomarinimicrobiota bacterium]